MPGWQRRRRGRGFSYVDQGEPLSDADRARCIALAIPPAWTDVWICPLPNGHLQAVGTDEAGRRQYLYHPDWRKVRDREKFSYMLEFASRLPRARRRVRGHLGQSPDPLTRTCALAFRMLDLGAFRIGSERYTDDNGSYGLLTLELRHLRLSGRNANFHYIAKSGQERNLTTSDPMILRALEPLRHRSGPADQRLLAYQEEDVWYELSSEQLNCYLKELLGEDASAKHFRTWQANVMAAAALAVRPADTPTARRKAITETFQDVAEFLGNTPAVARSGYVDSRLIDLYRNGTTVDSDLASQHMPEPGHATSARLEKAVRELLS